LWFIFTISKKYNTLTTNHSKTTFAVIGFGHIGKRHAALLTANPHAEVVAIADIDATQQAKVTELYPNAAFFATDTELLAHTKADVVCICTPNNLHAEQSIMALKAGSHVVVEKPMGLTKADCERVIFAALHHNKRVFCVMQNRYSPPSVWLKNVLEQNLLGDIYMVQVNCYWNRDDRYYGKSAWKGSRATDGGPLFTQFSHFIDLMYWLFGDITNVQARFACFNHTHNTDFEDSGTVNFELLSGGIGCINYSTSVWDANLESSLTVVAERGSLKVGGQYMDKVEYCHIADYIMPALPAAEPPNDYGAYKGSAANHHFVFENVINTLNGTATATTNALEGLKVVDIIEQIYTLRP
jgi:UDP-N-acetyl-2-amino-2-deoxyglucuronate dehydrogenase